MPNRLTRIGDAIGAVEEARAKCPFHLSCGGNETVAFDKACPVCGMSHNGSGGLCLIYRAEHDAILAIEEAIS